MLHKLRRKLIFLYTASTGAILIVCMIIIYQLNSLQLEKQTMENFLLNTDFLVKEIQSSGTLNVSSLSVLETTKHMIISVEDNGFPISFKGSYQSRTDREILLQRLQDQAILQGVDIQASNLYTSLKRSSLITIKGDHNDQYYGYVAIIPINSSYVSLRMICSMNEVFSGKNTNLAIYVIITFLGILGFFGVCFLMIRKVLHPVQENQQRQIEFVASASHELRSPLAYIQAATSELTEDCLNELSGESARTLSSYIHNTQEECSRMSQLIEDMLILASADRKTWTMHITPTDSDTFFINSYDTLSYLCEQKLHPLNLVLPEEQLGTLPIDKQHIYQILQILIQNACCYTPSKTPIHLKPYIQNHKLLIEVIDSGPGIPKEYKDRVFDRYFRMDSSRTDRNHFGLGLNIARELAHLHHGELTLQNTPGGGCTFLLSIPLTERS